MDELHDVLARVGALIAAGTLAIAWALLVLEIALPRLGLLAAQFVATPGGFVVTLLTWRALGPRRHRR